MTEAFSELERDKLNAIWIELIASLKKRLDSLQDEGLLKNVSLDEPLRNEFIIAADGSYLSVWLDTDRGKGSWNQIAPDDACEPWSMTPNGVGMLSGHMMSVGELANAFATKLIAKNK